MKKLDLYILKKFLGTFIFIIVLLNIITIVIDMSEKIDDFLDVELSWFNIFRLYYINFIPYMSALLGPFFVFISVIFFTSQMASRSEIVAILSSGTSFYRMLYPYFLGALILAGLQFMANNYWVPKANENRLQFELTYVMKRSFDNFKDVQNLINEDQVVFIQNWRGNDSTGYKFTLETYGDGKLVSKLKADKITFVKDSGAWQLNNYIERTFFDNREEINKGKTIFMKLDMDPIDIGKRFAMKEEMKTPELTAFIEDLKSSGIDTYVFYEVEKYRRTSAAFSIFILTLIGVAVASKKTRGGLGFHLVYGIAASALYVIIFQFSATFSTNANLSPVIGVWIPNFIFAIVAIYMVRKAPK